jgi:hypothetical protein
MKIITVRDGGMLPASYTGCIIYNSNKLWYHNGKDHRLDGPAWEWADVSKLWWINGKRITKQTRIICLL